MTTATASTDSLGPVKPWVARAAAELGTKFGISSIGGYRPGAIDPNGHPAGLALDFMTGHGQPLADYARANAKRLGVLYVIWNQHIWSVARARQGWRPMPDRGSATANHRDHVHVSFVAHDPGASAPPPGGGSWSTKPGVPATPGTTPGSGTPASLTSATKSLTGALVHLVVTVNVLTLGAVLVAIGAWKLTKSPKETS